MSELLTESVAQEQQEQQEQKTGTRAAVERIAGFATAVAVFAVLVAAAVYAQDKYSLKSPGGIAFSDFKDTRTGRSSLPPAPTKCLKSWSPIRP